MRLSMSSATRAHLVRWSCMLRTLLAISFVVSTVSLYAQTFNFTLHSGQPGITYYSPPNLPCGRPLSNQPFTAADFTAAASGAPAVVGNHSYCPNGQLPCNPNARWIGLGTNLQPARSILFAQRFDLPCQPVEGTVTLTFCWMVDDFLGDPTSGPYAGPNNAGVYINGVPLNISGAAAGNCSNFKQVSVNVPSSILNAGANYLYVYVRDAECVLAGVMYSATISGLCWSCRLNNCQQWNDCLPAVPSTVRECAPVAPNNILGAVAGDDFIGRYTGPVNTVEWWGVVSHSSQRYRPYQISIYRDTEQCAPYLQQPIYRACVNPISVQAAGVDCQGRRVWRFRAIIPVFNQTQGVRYWLSISEIDAFSWRPGVPDFWWSGHRACGSAQCGCQALLATAAPTGGIQLSPVVSRCDAQPMDLAWCLGWRSWFKVGLHDMPPSPLMRYQISIPGGATIEEGTVPIEEIEDEYGTRRIVAAIPTEIPGSPVEIKVWPVGALPRRYVWNTNDSITERTMEPVIGDVNGDGQIDDADLLQVLFNFGAGG